VIASEHTVKLFPIGTSKTRQGRENQAPIRTTYKGLSSILTRVFQKRCWDVRACRERAELCELQLPYGAGDNGSTPRQSSAVEGTGGIFVIEITVETLHLACNMCAVPKRKRAARKGLRPATIPERRTYSVIRRRNRKS
jgi:hypothetical protein